MCPTFADGLQAQADPAWLSEGLEVKEANLTGKEYFSVKEFKDRLGVSRAV